MSETDNGPTSSLGAEMALDKATPVRVEDDSEEEEDDQELTWEEFQPQVLDLCKSLWPSASKHECLNQVSGGFNEVVFVTITTPSPDEHDVATDFVIRLPQDDWFGVPVIDSVAALQHIGQTTQIRVPRVVAFDATAENPVRNPYVVLERIPGRPLNEVFYDFTDEQRTVLAKELGELYRQLRNTKSSYSGRIAASPSHRPSSVRPAETPSQIPVNIEPYGARIPESVAAKLASSTLGPVAGLHDRDNVFIASGGLTSDPPNLPLADMATRIFTRRILQQDIVRGVGRGTTAHLGNLRDMLATIIAEGRVAGTGGDFCLWHNDLFPRNIMVDPSASPIITGVLDWDDTYYTPEFATAAAPTWLWEEREEGESEDEEGQGQDEDYGPHPEEETLERTTREPATAARAAVKRAFEEAAGPEYRRSCADHYAVLARRALHFAEEWQWPMWWYTWHRETMAEWEALRAREEPGDEPEGDDDGGSGDGAGKDCGDDAQDQTESDDEDEDMDAWETCSEGDDAWETSTEGDDDAWETCSEEEPDEEAEKK